MRALWTVSPPSWGRAARRWGLVVALAALWEASAHLGWVDALLLPPLSQVLGRGWALLRSGRLPLDLAASAWRVLLGFGAAALVGLPLGVLMGLSRRLEELGRLPISLLRPLSPPAWIPLAILWFGIGDLPAVFIVFVGTCATLLTGTLAATHTLDPLLIQAGRTLGASRWQTVRHVVLPALLPSLLAQLRVGLGLAWMSVIAAEMVAVRHGLGFAMSEARHLFRTADVLVGMITIGLVGVISDRLVRLLETALCRWRVGQDPARALADADGRP
jgi:ABC-type nitrate/sulfonate/bicarbonate transport system permease component